VTEKSVLADALQLSLGRCREEAATFTEAQSASTPRIDGTGRESYDCSAKASYYLRRSESAFTSKRLCKLENELQIPILRRILRQSLTSYCSRSVGEVQPSNNQSTDHVKLYRQPDGITSCGSHRAFEPFPCPLSPPPFPLPDESICYTRKRYT
jgi:hypothetical protein